ncbi:hypothetical protein CYMTET_48479 [Cymbomonas tetramitiformis]|uniref:Reverse transcriptase domain-containing protein n=1 Tax=Cymbomonas tetramitiformis TaxID=36881 RepID=A0AAE0EWR7_9CHLO|nr:hypothetical protein CYMTET_48479 [Cymbomonas tetramitiformis]
MPESMDREIHFYITYVVDLITQMGKYDVKCVVDYDKLVRQKLATGSSLRGTPTCSTPLGCVFCKLGWRLDSRQRRRSVWLQPRRAEAWGNQAEESPPRPWCASSETQANAPRKGASTRGATSDYNLSVPKASVTKGNEENLEKGTGSGNTVSPPAFFPVYSREGKFISPSPVLGQRVWVQPEFSARSAKMASLLLTYLTILNSVDLSEHGVSLEALREFESSTVEMGAAVPKVTEFADRWAVVFQDDPAVDDLVRLVSLGAGWKFNPDSVVMSGKNYVKEGFDFSLCKKRMESLRVVPVPEGWARAIHGVGVVDKDHSNFEKVRVVHNYSENDGSSVNAGTDILAQKWQSISDAFSFLRPGHFMVKVDIKRAYRHFPIVLQYLPYHTYQWRAGEAQEALLLLGDVLRFLGLEMAEENLPGEKCVRLRTQVLALAEKGEMSSSHFSVDASTGTGMGGFLDGDFFGMSWILKILQPFLECKRRQNVGTAACFVIPLWPTAGFFKFIEARPTVFFPLVRFDADSDLFTAPAAPGQSRRDFGPTTWPVTIYKVPPRFIDLGESGGLHRDGASGP